MNKIIAFLVALFSGSVEAQTPPGYIELCQRDDRACLSHPTQLIDLDAEMFSFLSTVNARINDRIAYMDDIDIYNKPDYWARGETAGDCEDIALAKIYTLLDAGIPRGAMNLATVITHNHKKHVILLINAKQGIFVMDSMFDQILPWRATPYSYWYVEQPNQGEWIRMCRD